MIEPVQPRPIKVTCRNLWKIYGPQDNGARYEDLDTEDHVRVCERLRATGRFPAVIAADFTVHAGEIFVIMGLSGSGKSTLVRCLSRLIEPSAGQVILDGEDLLAASTKRLIALRRREMGMVFQHFGLLPHLNVLDNVAFPLRIQGRSIEERDSRAREMISLVGLDGREESFPNQLSGGQQQRVGLARSLAVGPTLWFLDEPFSALDPLIRRQMQDEFLRIQSKLDKTIIFITHDIQEALRLADRIAIMRAGRIIQIGRPTEIVLEPADEYVARFVEDISLARVILAKDIMQPINGGIPPTDAVAPTATVEDLLARVARGSAGFRVVDDLGLAIGTIAATDVLAVVDRDLRRRR